MQLQVLNFENMPNFYGFWANAYRGHLGAIISAPNGWVVNSDLSPDLLPDMLGFLHPMEFTPRVASSKKHFMYFQIYPIIDNKDLKTTKNHFEDDSLSKSMFALKEEFKQQLTPMRVKEKDDWKKDKRPLIYAYTGDMNPGIEK